MHLAVGGSVGVGNVFWFMKTLKNLTFWSCIEVLDLVLKCFSDVNEGIWIHFSFLILFVNIVCIVDWIEFFSAVGQVFQWSFLALHIFWNVCNWVPKLNWPRNDWFLSSLSDCASSFVVMSAWTKICKICSIVILFQWHELFKVISLRGQESVHVLLRFPQKLFFEV